MGGEWSQRSFISQNLSTVRRHRYHCTEYWKAMDASDRIILDPSLDLTKPIHSGVLYKQSHFHKSFNKRFFALFPKILVYYESEEVFLKGKSLAVRIKIS